MEKVLYFLSYYNTQIIQSGFAVVFLLIIIYVYRAFFMASSSGEDVADTNHPTVIEQKLNQILEQQRSKSNVAADATLTSSGSKNGVSEQEVDKLKLEIYNLRQQLNDENKSQIPKASTATDVDSENSEANSEVAKANEAMVVKVKELESRLAEYEIIADDIAELSQLRAENAKLKEQLAQVRSTSVQPAAVVEAAAPPATSPQASDDVSSSQALVDALFAEANASAVQAESAVPDGDQNLLNEFEKITQKKGNE